jgi:hypothetical protein
MEVSNGLAMILLITLKNCQLLCLNQFVLLLDLAYYLPLVNLVVDLNGKYFLRCAKKVSTPSGSFQHFFSTFLRHVISILSMNFVAIAMHCVAFLLWFFTAGSENTFVFCIPKHHAAAQH